VLPFGATALPKGAVEVARFAIEVNASAGRVSVLIVSPLAMVLS
jgi:hypothetical protein